MRVVVESVFPCEADQAWAEVQTSQLLREVTFPLITLRGERGSELPAVWQRDSTIRCRSYLFGILPLGTRTIAFERFDGARREIQTRETDRLVPRWDHLVSIAPAGPGTCRYRDDITIEAGWRTLPVWLFAQCFYRHRQRRWQRVARRLNDRSR